MKAIRIEEQKTAANIGQFSFIAQLGHPSNHVKDSTERATLVEDIKAIIVASQPDVIYTHNPFDKHATHIGVLLATLSAIHELPLDDRPKQLIGCEVWRGLDWLPDDEKIVHDVSAHPDLATSLAGVFASQIAGGKRYDLAVEGRRLANATFFDSHSIDASDRVQYAIDLSSLISGQNSLRNLMNEKLNIFQEEIFELLEDVSG
jgi:LmbE family N-acetylglucosaminyl deacetylase